MRQEETSGSLLSRHHHIETTIVPTSAGNPTNSAAAAATTTKFHRAAIDGYVDMLCEASKRDTNLASNEDNGLTPTLLAAHHGHLDALRILVGRGGDPEKTTLDVNFGVNMWALNNELHTAKDVAAIGQKKEVLDYLDQMMAKQSALNTKSVQKLKEKAKLGAEKRLKQMRKAQLKAIKQVEKDERYLVKLSNNRRLLKAAHSISDIKLVGRSEAAVNYSPSQLASSTSTASNASLAKFINQKLRLDGGLLGANARLRTHSSQTQLNFHQHQSTKQLSSLCSNSAYDDSAYSTSSVSTSTSGYLSSCGKSLLSSTKSSALVSSRPKYSDLVAVGGGSGSGGPMTGLPVGPSQTNGKRPVNESQQQQLSLKSNSSIGTRFGGGRSAGGVSRKVQLKRLLLINSTSSSNHTGDGGGSSISAEMDQLQQQQRRPACEDRDRQQASALERHKDQQSSPNGRLCNVQPPIKLKLNSEASQLMMQSTARATLHTDQQQQQQQQHHDSFGAICIEWPPAPVMSRAVSEPDFGAALRRDFEGDGSSNNNDSCGDEDVTSLSARDDNGDGGGETEVQVRNGEDRIEAPTISTGIPSGGGGDKSCDSTRDQSQHLLLTQCLSQLKLRHEAITSCQESSSTGSAVDKASQLLRPSMVAAGKLVAGAGPTISKSDELLQHQLSAGEFPLRPSIIKQQQQQQQHLGPCQQTQLNNSGGSSNIQPANVVITTKHAYPYPQAKLSVDSIGSASSFVQRNSSSSSASSSSFMSYASSSASYSSSLETKPATATAAAAAAVRAEAAPRWPSRKSDQPASSSAAIAAPGDDSNRADSNKQVPPEETIETFLVSNGLAEEVREVFAREKIDLEALVLLTEDDLKSLNILLGPRRKLLKAVEDRCRRLSCPVVPQPQQCPGNNVKYNVIRMVDTAL